MKNINIKNIDYNIVNKWSCNTSLSFHDNILFSMKDNNESIYFRIRVDWESWLIKEKFGINNKYHLNPNYEDLLFIDIVVDKLSGDKNNYSKEIKEYIGRDINNFIVNYRDNAFTCEFCFLDEMDDENEQDHSFLFINGTNIRWRLTNEVIIKKNNFFIEDKIEQYLIKKYNNIKEF